jgi:hypothetical protein
MSPLDDEWSNLSAGSETVARIPSARDIEDSVPDEERPTVHMPRALARRLLTATLPGAA